MRLKRTFTIFPPIFRLFLFIMAITSCSTMDNEKRTKDVTFTIPVICSHLYICDYYGEKLIQSQTQTDVDTTTVTFRKMEYGTHRISLMTDDTTTDHEFTVSDSTKESYVLTPLTISIEIDDTWEGEIEY